MVRGITIVLIISITYLTAYSQIPSGYYDSANGLTGDALKTALNDIIDGHTEFSYEAVKDALRATDEDPNNSNNVICLYTGWSYSKTEFGNGSEQWNREHTWSKSHGDFGDLPPAGTDIHHLRPTDASVNSAKNNRDFSTGTYEYIDGSGPTGCYMDTDIWEPRDAVKGDVARMIFYMATRYEGENDEVDLEIVDYVNTAPNQEAYYGKLTTLMQWHIDDPVDSWEESRNNIIYTSYQGNRNPYIDHPEYVNLIWGTFYPEPSNHVLSFVTSALAPTTITLTWNDNDGANPADKFLILINTTGSFVTPVDGTEQNNDTDYSDNSGQVNVLQGAETYTFTGLSASTTYYFEIYPYTNFGINTDYKTDGTIPSTNGLTNVSNIYLYISEVADPGDYWEARYVELFNSGTSTIDFDSEIWYFCRQANGSSTSWNDTELTGTIGSGETFVLAYNATYYQNAYGSSPDQTTGDNSGNGDDGFFLYSGGDHTTGALIDAYGVIDQNGNGLEWEYTDSKAVRKYRDTIPSQTWQPSQWIINTAANAEHMTPDWHRKILEWTGAISSDWETAGNWNNDGSSSNFAPDAGCKITIPSTTTSPAISSEASCDFLELQPGVMLNINSGTLTVGN